MIDCGYVLNSRKISESSHYFSQAWLHLEFSITLTEGANLLYSNGRVSVEIQ
jgi:hypothetical protein